MMSPPSSSTTANRVSAAPDEPALADQTLISSLRLDGDDDDTMARRSSLSSPPAARTPTLRRLSTPTKPPWLNKLLSPFTSQALAGSPKVGPSVVPPPQVDEGFFESSDELNARNFDMLTAFPMEISLTILSFLPATDLARLGSVSRAWSALLSDNLLWKAAFEKAPGCELRPSYLASLAGDFSSTALSPSQAAPSSPTQPLSTMSLSPAPLVAAAPPVLPPPWKYLYKKRTWVARRFARNNPHFSDSDSDSSISSSDGDKVVERELVGHTDSIYAVWFDGHKVITGSRDRSIKVWDINSGELLQTVDNAHNSSVLCLEFEEVAPEGRQRAMGVSGGSDGVVALWDLGGPGLPTQKVTKVGALTGHTQGVLDVAINPHYIVSCSKDTSILVHNRAYPHELLHRLDLHTGPVNALSLDGHTLASASGDGRVRIWDLKSGEQVRRMRGHERGLACVSLKEDWVISGSNDKTIKIWDLKTGECLRTLVGHTDLVRSLDSSPSAGLIVSGGYDKQILVWSLETGQLIRSLRSSHTSHVFDLSLDASKIVSAGHDNKLLVYDFGDEETGRMFA